MKKLILTLLMCISTLATSFAQLSPLTEVEFYKAYLDVPLVKSASLANGKINNTMLDYIFKKGNPSEIKYAIINALGAKLKSQNQDIYEANRKTFNDYLSAKNYDNFNQETMKLFSIETQLCIVYFEIINYIEDIFDIYPIVADYGVSCSRADAIMWSLLYTQNEMDPFIRDLREYIHSGESITDEYLNDFKKQWEKPAIEATKMVKNSCFDQNCDEADEYTNNMRSKAIDIIWNYFKEYDKAQATITIISKSANPYQVSINGKVLGKTDPYEHYEYTCTPGYYHIKAVQVSGYVFSPTVNERDVNVGDGGNVTVTIGYED
ncbi:MAG: hypothetical protein J6Z01_14700 [Bacteroidales bacterium]|nr:hypothetical protein [Bacteroidales bacterium]